MNWCDYYVLRCWVPVLVLKLAYPHHLQGWRFSENLAIAFLALLLGMAMLESPSNGLSDICAQVHTVTFWHRWKMVGFGSSLKHLWISENVCSNLQLGVEFPLIYSCTKYCMHKHVRNLSPQCYSLYKYHLPAITETFLCCFWAFTVGNDIICYIFEPILRHRPVSWNKRGVSQPPLS